MNNLDNKKGMKSWQADLVLLLITICWGLSYLVVDLCAESMMPFTMNLYRFIPAGIIGLLLGFKRIKKNINKKTVLWSIPMGLLLFIVYFCSTYGIINTKVSNAGFLCNTAVLFTPLITVFILKKKIDHKTILSMILCLIGMALLTIGPDFSIGSDSFKGDMLCIGCGFFYAIDLLVTEKAVKDETVDPFTLGILQLLVTGIIELIFAILFEGVTLPPNRTITLYLVFLSIFCTGIPFVVQAIAQKYTEASRVGIIYTIEPVFTSLSAFIILHEVLTTLGYIGCAIMLISVFILEIDFKKKDI